LTLSVTAPSMDTPGIYRTHGLGCLAEIVLTDPDSVVGAIEIVHEELDRIDLAASRFRSDAEIALVNRAEGRPIKVSPCLFGAVAVALRVAEVTGGAVDPTVGGAMNRLGYDRDFAAIGAGIPGNLPEPAPVPGWRSVQLDRASGTLRVPAGTVIDLGASAKALTADRIAQRVAATFGCGVLVSLGGDISVAGSPPTGGFCTGLADVSGAAEASETVAISSGGLATSGITSRWWRVGYHVVHHIVDPSTGLPPPPAWRTITVAAASCVDANAASTAAMVKGLGGRDWLAARNLPARLIGLDGTVVRVAGWPSPVASEPDVVGRVR
jgi:thiamine biosynthesis lipoprotein ApbE